MTLGGIGSMYGMGYMGTYYTAGTQQGNPVLGAETEEMTKKAGRMSSPEECQTCSERKYQDGSDENVSFKSASHISPETAPARVKAHEMEHVANAYDKAEQGNGKVISASVSIRTAVCPECGRTFVAGGETNTLIKYSNEENPYQREKKAQDAILLRGANVDLVA